MPSAEAPTSGRVISKVASASAAARLLAFAAPLQLALQLLLAAEQVLDRDPAVVEHDLGGVRGADPELGLLLALAQAGGALGDDEGGLAAGAELRVDGGDDDVDVGDAAVGDEDLGPVEDPLVAVAPGGRLQALDVGAGLRLGHRVGAELDLVAAAEALGDPAGRSARGCRRRRCRRRRGRSRRSPARCRRSPSGTLRRRSPASGPRGRRRSAECPRGRRSPACAPP